MNHKCKQQQQQEEQQKQLTEGRTTHKRGYFLLVSLLPSVHAEGDKGKRMHGSFPSLPPFSSWKERRKSTCCIPYAQKTYTTYSGAHHTCTLHKGRGSHKTHREKGRRGIASPSFVKKDAPTGGCWLLNKEAGAQQAHPYTHKTHTHTNR